MTGPGHGGNSTVSSVDSERRGPAPAAAGRAGVTAQLRPFVHRIHFLAGILVAPFVLVLCVTGLVYVFSPQVHDDLYHGQLYVDRVGVTANPVATQVRAALVAHPEAELLSVVPPSEPDRTTQVNLSVPGVSGPDQARTVYVDPYTDLISGELTTVDGRLPANVWLRDLHSDLHLGEAGRVYAELGASWLPVIVAAGLLLWIADRGRKWRGAKQFVVPARRGKGEQSRMRSVHAPLGVCLTLGLLAVSLTGLTMSRFAGADLFDAGTPTLARTTVNIPAGAHPIGLDRVVEVATEHGLDGKLEVEPPAAPDLPYTVMEKSHGLPIHRDAVAIDPYSGQVTDAVGWDDYSLTAKLRVLAVDAHTGVLFGLANQILLAALAVGTLVLIVVGYRMWWKRSPYRGQWPPPPPRAPRPITPVSVMLVAVLLVLGWILPVFGVSLLAFMLLDRMISSTKRHRAAA